jgi:hypothetical protein
VTKKLVIKSFERDGDELNLVQVINKAKIYQNETLEWVV